MKGAKGRNTGFTMVEIMAVLVILAALVALSLPYLLNWTTRFRHQTAIMECRSVVMSSQVKVAELYAQNDYFDRTEWRTQDDYLEYRLNQDEAQSAILSLAGVGGTLRHDSLELEGYDVDRLVYTSQDEVTVVYDRERRKPYRILEADGRYLGDEAADYITELEYALQKMQWMDEDYVLQMDLMRSMLVPSLAEKGKDSVSMLVQQYFLNITNDSHIFPQIHELELEDITELLKNAGIDDTTGKMQRAVWKPMADKNGHVYLIAAVTNIKKKGDSNAILVYDKNTYYAFTKDGKTLSSTPVTDQSWTLEELQDAACWQRLIPLEGEKNERQDVTQNPGEKDGKKGVYTG